MLLFGLVAGFVLGLVLMGAIGLFEWERGYRAGLGERRAQDRVVRERWAQRALGRAA